MIGSFTQDDGDPGNDVQNLRRLPHWPEPSGARDQVNGRERLQEPGMLCSRDLGV